MVDQCVAADVAPPDYNFHACSAQVDVLRKDKETLESQLAGMRRQVLEPTLAITPTLCSAAIVIMSLLFHHQRLVCNLFFCSVPKLAVLLLSSNPYSVTDSGRFAIFFSAVCRLFAVLTSFSRPDSLTACSQCVIHFSANSSHMSPLSIHRHLISFSQPSYMHRLPLCLLPPITVLRPYKYPQCGGTF